MYISNYIGILNYSTLLLAPTKYTGKLVVVVVVCCRLFHISFLHQLFLYLYYYSLSYYYIYYFFYLHRIFQQHVYHTQPPPHTLISSRRIVLIGHFSFNNHCKLYCSIFTPGGIEWVDWTSLSSSPSSCCSLLPNGLIVDST